jgi:hypothetical protein
LTIRGLQETTVATEDLVFLVSCEAVERGRGIDDGTVVTTDIGDSE